jgi:hypothetical protein
MKMLALGRYILHVSVGSALLGGCGGTQPPLAGSQTPPNNATKLARFRGDLLYVVNGQAVEFLTFPGGKRIGRISGIGRPLNVCSDTSGNLWFTSQFHTHEYRLYEFTHGGTQPVATIDVPKSKTATACAVNPINGDLAVLNSFYGSGDRGSVLIWTGARGVPKEYPVFFEPTACDYDEHGNLLAAGWADSDGYFFGELKSGAGKVTEISVKPRTFFVGGVRWDGRYFAVAVQQRRGSLIYRLNVSGSTGKVVEIIHPKPLPSQTWFGVKGDTMIATERTHSGRTLGIWRYPTSSMPRNSFPSLPDRLGLAVSVGS